MTIYATKVKACKTKAFSVKGTKIKTYRCSIPVSMLNIRQQCPFILLEGYAYIYADNGAIIYDDNGVLLVTDV